MGRGEADLAAPVLRLIIADREVYAVAVNVNGLAVRRENNELKRCGGIVRFSGHAVIPPFQRSLAYTSSMEPAMRKFCSGMLSQSPPRMASKPLIVSSMCTNLPAYR